MGKILLFSFLTKLYCKTIFDENNWQNLILLNVKHDMYRLEIINKFKKLKIYAARISVSKITTDYKKCWRFLIINSVF